MSNSLWFSRIFTLQSSSWFCFNYFFDCFLGVFEKDYYYSDIFLITIDIFFSFPFLILILFECRTNSFIYSPVEQFLETHFHKSNYRGKGYTFGNFLPKFSDLYTLLLVWGYIIRATSLSVAYDNTIEENNLKLRS